MATFTFTQADLDNFVNNAQCCFASKVIEMINLKAIGDDSYDLKEAECMTLDMLLRTISVDLSIETCLTEEDFQSIFQKLTQACCGCGC